MKKALPVLLILLVFAGCQKKVSAADIAKINGYWEIEKVVFPDGNQKEYSINESYDYIEVKDNNGSRTKVMPQLDGTFLTNDLSEKISIQEKDGQYAIHCVTPYAKWTETIVALSDSILVLKNQSEKEYHYKKATPINIIPHGKKAQ